MSQSLQQLTAQTDLEIDFSFQDTENDDLSCMTLYQQQIKLHQFESSCLRLTHELSHMQQLDSELPKYLEVLKAQPSFSTLPDCAIVVCYPFSQECFIYHALEQGLNSKTITSIQRKLLALSARSFKEPSLQNFYIEKHQVMELYVAAHYVVWRIYFDHTPISETVQTLDRLDQAFKHGFAARDRQENYIQTVLQQERKAFSADLHDSIAQVLGFLRIKTSQLHQQCKQPAFIALLEQSEEVASYTHYAYQQVRELITASRLAYQELDFIVSVKKIIQEFEQQSSIIFELDHRGHHIHVVPNQSVQLLYILRESLSNVVRHSHASHSQILIELQGDLLNLKVIDDGQGIQKELKRKDSFGLEIMRERAERIGGQLEIYSMQPKGTCVELKLQLTAKER
jgi:nitrate/nitrite-specific signal transduction histidine kinase